MESHERTAKTRLAGAGAVTLLLWLVVVVRLVQVGVFSRDRWIAEAARQQDRTLQLAAERGSLLDREGRELAVSATSWSAWADPQAFPDDKARSRAARRLASVLDTDEATLRERLSRDAQFAWLQRQLTPEGRERVEALRVDGIGFVRESRRLYPNESMLAQVLGFVGVDGDGLEGLELALDSRVKGRPGVLVFSRDARGQSYIPGGLTYVAPKRGADVELTLDAAVQQAADRELEEAVLRTGSKSGTAVVMFPFTGEVAALSNYPTYDPNNTPAHPSYLRTNRAVASCYEPGSTLKIFTAAAALSAGVRPGDTFDCEHGGVRVGRTYVRDHEPFGVLTLTDVLALSSNVGAIKLGQRAGALRLRDTLARFGFGRPTGITLPGESAGILRDASQWTPLSLASVSFGQEIAVTPLQLATAACAVANGGTLHQPRLVREVREEGGAVVPSVRSPRRVLSEDDARTLSRMLEHVVTDGTAKAAAIAGYRVAGKTGTAQKIVDGAYSTTAHVASFVGWAPARNPAVLCLVVLDEPRGPAFHGGDIAAPVFRAIVADALRQLRIPPDDPSHVIAPDVAQAPAAPGEALPHA